MTTPIRLALLIFVCSTGFAKQHPRIKVKVIENLPTTSSYEWQVAGKGSVSCSSSNCSIQYMPPQSGTQMLHGAVLKLQLPDSRIVIAECVAKVQAALTLLSMAVQNDPTSPMIYRDCRVPSVNSVIEAEFNQNSVKLFMQAPSIDGSGKISNETYFIRGVLQPVSSTGRAQATTDISVSGGGRYEQVSADFIDLADQYAGLKRRIEAIGKLCNKAEDETCLYGLDRILADGTRVDHALLEVLDQLIPLVRAREDDTAQQDLTACVQARERIADELKQFPDIEAKIDAARSAMKK